MVRVDYEKRIKIDDKVKSQILARFSDLISGVDAVILEDYAKGLLTSELCQEIIKTSKKMGKLTFVDPHSTTPADFYLNCDIITPNRSEAYALANHVDDPQGNRSVSVEELGVQLRQKIKCRDLIITRGHEGVSLFNDSGHVRLPTFAKEVFDVTGAGDSVIAALALGVSSGLSMSSACVLANYAAGVVVSKVGSVPCEAKELIAELSAEA
jgi:rfaE bifunctional protein kinase chain/domain